MNLRYLGSKTQLVGNYQLLGLLSLLIEQFTN